MKRSIYSYLLLPFLLLLVSCDRTMEPDSSFVAGSGIQLMVAGRVILTYDPPTWQLGYNPSANEFRAGDDAMKNFFIVTCSKCPSRLGEKIDATVSWTVGNATESLKGRFEVAKVEGDRYWLWCGDKKTQAGVTVCVLR